MDGKYSLLISIVKLVSGFWEPGPWEQVVCENGEDQGHEWVVFDDETPAVIWL